jgi:hypothetical protein
MEKKWAFQILSGDGNAMLISLSLPPFSHCIAYGGCLFGFFAQLACAVWRQTNEVERLSWFRNGMQVIRWRRK